jgi:peptide/nickel transport system permease protein
MNRFALAGVVGFLLLAIFAPILLGDKAQEDDILKAGLGVGQQGHLLGTDMLGRDVLARTLVGTRTSLELALIASVLATVLGSLAGIALALCGARIRAVGSRIIDATLGFPDILLAVMIVTVVGVGSRQAAIAVGIAIVPFFARLAFTLASAVRKMDYVTSAEALGVGRRRRLTHYLLPNVAEPLLIAGFLAVSYSVIAISSLSFLGLGVQAPDYDWGLLLVEGLKTIYVTPAAAIAPAIAIALSGLLFGVVGELASRAADPTLRSLDAAPKGAKRRAVERLERAATIALTDPVSEDTVLSVRNLTVSFPGPDGDYSPVKDVSFDVGRQEIVGIVGESGSGKTLTALAVGGLVPYPGVASADRLQLGRNRVSYVFQDPNASLNPALRIGRQLTEALPGKRKRREATAEAAEALREVDVSAPEARLRQYAHQLSGGLKQRVSIAMSLLSRSELVIADEPTTALDLTVQAQVLSVIRKVNERDGLSVLLISHSLGVVAELCDRVIVMYAGRIVEEGPVEEILANPKHPYTRALIDAMPRLSSDRSQPLAVIPGRVPSPKDEQLGCPFAPRCPARMERCDVMPADIEVDRSRVACWLHEVEVPA